MGSYVYKVTGKTCKLSNGETANIAVYAYKPYRDFWNKEAEKMNIRAARKAGIPYAEIQADLGKRSCWVVHGEEGHCVLHFPFPVGSYDDDHACDKYMQTGITVEGRE